MNFISCLTPKNEVDFISDDASLLKTLQIMQHQNYAAIPIINKSGEYVGTITSGDILGYIKENYDLSLKAAADHPLRNIKRTRDNRAVKINATMEEILDVAMSQNFVPVIDDQNKFIGIITRRGIMKCLAENGDKKEA